ncbi:EAL domain-containing protein [Undibacterium cyanobacteriorum]|uniref:EAL domain-containing protein n=1 Tax=Undibacterium cyanobacteriorum TaxID=3073561 RepID=A0ABY9REP9_9BURK|nr:EAL domain-containing protein [Undibacterium sp. 20NA77.5]WMW79702.1 EAL domain-containing protein [Undibacterium sp. 20NA77.5]
MNPQLRSLLQVLGLNSIATRLTLSFAFLLMLFVGIGLTTVEQVRQIAQSNSRFQQTDMQRLRDVQELRSEFEGIGIQLLDVFTKNYESKNDLYVLIDARAAKIKQQFERLKQYQLNAEQQQALNTLIECNDLFRSHYYEVLDQYALDDLAGAKKIYTEQVEASRNTLLKEAQNFLDQEKLSFEARQREEEFKLKEMQERVFLLAAIAILIGASLALLTRRGVVRPLVVLETSAQKIAEGDYESKVPSTETIEVARVGQALNSMSEAIAQREREIEQLAYYDNLTHLPNRTLLLKQFDNMNLNGCGLVLMDIARLKTVNETLGFVTGDTLILETARRIQTALLEFNQEGTALAKFNGGTFAIVLPAIRKASSDGGIAHSDSEDVYELQSAQIKELLGLIDHHLTDPVRCSGYTVDVNLVYGIALCNAKSAATMNQAERSLNTLIRNGEVALYAAKAQTQTVVWYSDAQEASRLSHLSLLSDLRSAVQNSELQMWLQPKVKLADMQTYGFEALVRWQHPQRGFISPAEFVPFAERTGYISTVTMWMIERALQSLQLWQAQGLNLSIAVNVSTNDLRDESFPDRVRALMQRYDVSPANLRLELTESGIMEDPSSAIPLLQKLRELGIGLSIDDFGTGHSSLAYLQKLPVTELKIDRSFVINIDQLPSTQRLVKTIVEMGHGLQLSVIAEGIETAAERDTLRELGCDSMQGYFASKPLHGESLQKWLDQILLNARQT